MTFDALHSIEESVSPQRSDALETIIKIGEGIAKEHVPQIGLDFHIPEGEYRRYYERIEGVTVTAALLQQYIISCLDSVSCLNRSTSIYARGVYSGMLLTRLHEQSSGPVLFDGLGQTFPYLFSQARYTPPTVLRDMRGFGIGKCLGEEGHASVTFIDVKSTFLCRDAGLRGGMNAVLLRTLMPLAFGLHY
jgi:hypothetical protein